jgi:hypothetical protein
MRDPAEVDKFLFRVHQEQDHLRQLRSHEAKSIQDWVNFSPTLFPEDFETAMIDLGPNLDRIDDLLRVLDHLKAALGEQRQRLTRQKDHP